MSDLYCGAEVTGEPVENEEPGAAETAGMPELTDVPGESGMPQNVSQNMLFAIVPTFQRNGVAVE